MNKRFGFALLGLVSLIAFDACTTVVVRRPHPDLAYRRCRMNHPYRPWICR